MKVIHRRGNHYTVNRLNKAKHYGGIADQVKKRREAIEAGNRAMEQVRAEINAPGGSTIDDNGAARHITTPANRHTTTPQGGTL